MEFTKAKAQNTKTLTSNLHGPINRRIDEKTSYPSGKIFFARLISFIPGELLKMVPNKDREREYLQSVPALFAGKTCAAVVPFLVSFRIPLLLPRLKQKLYTNLI